MLCIVCGRPQSAVNRDAKTQAFAAVRIPHSALPNFLVSASCPRDISARAETETIHFANISFHYLFYHAICQLIHFKRRPSAQ